MYVHLVMCNTKFFPGIHIVRMTKLWEINSLLFMLSKLMLTHLLTDNSSLTDDIFQG